MVNKITRVVLFVMMMIAVAACGTNPASQPSASTAAPPSRATDAPAQAVAPTAVQAVAVATPSAAAAAPSAAPRSPYADIEQGRTPEGYHVLGSANAPVTLVMYSDFF